MAAFPDVQAKIRNIVEAEGLTPDEVMKRLHEQTELQLLGDEAPDENHIPSHIYVIAQALAYRSATVEDEAELHGLLSEAYREEVHGPEKFRGGEAVDREEIKQHLSREQYKWLVAEAPNGHGVEKDGVLMGACCYSANGVSRRNGVEEGKLASIRFFAVRKAYQGLCVGRRLLQKVEERVFGEEMCCRVMACLPSPRCTAMRWMERRGYHLVGSLAYPFRGLGHTPLEEGGTGAEVRLNQYVLMNPQGNPMLSSSKSSDVHGEAIAEEKKETNSNTTNTTNNTNNNTKSRRRVMAVSDLIVEEINQDVGVD